ncbi:MAG: hypothetical protein IPG50_16635 [Myxococcales bacterium]|nr:hypothetical protein [Myxococcales bacterium]
MEELLDRVVRVQHVRGSALFDAQGRVHLDRSSGASAETRASMRLLVESTLRARADEARRDIGSFKILVRRMGAFVCAVICAAEADEVALRLQLNVLAIKISALSTAPRRDRTSSMPPNAVQALERELVSDVGPLGKMLFLAGLKRFNVTTESVTMDVARDLVSHLAGEIPERARRSWLERGGAIIEAAATGLPRPMPPLVRADSAPRSGVQPKSGATERRIA